MDAPAPGGHSQEASGSTGAPVGATEAAPPAAVAAVAEKEAASGDEVVEKETEDVPAVKEKEGGETKVEGEMVATDLTPGTDEHEKTQTAAP